MKYLLFLKYIEVYTHSKEKKSSIIALHMLTDCPSY